MKLQQISSATWRNYAMFCVGFFLITTLLTAFVVIPKLSGIVGSQHQQDIQTELHLEVELFKRFVNHQKRVLDDFSRSPTLINAVMLSDASSVTVQDLFDNTVIEGAAGRLVLQNIAQTILIQTSQDLSSSYTTTESWAVELLEGSIPYYFKLLVQEKEEFTFQLSVPVSYNGFIEGILSAEITVPLHQAFAALAFDNNIALRLSQGETTVQTNMRGIDIPYEISVEVGQPRLRFTYITDHAPIRDKERLLRTTILSALLAGLLISFILFGLLGYFQFTSSEDKLERAPGLSRRYAFPAFIGLIGVAATMASYFMVKYSEQATKEKALIADAKFSVQLIREKISTKLEILDAISAFYKASQLVDRREFQIFTAPILATHSDIETLQWIPFIAHEKRETFERQLQSDGVRNFGIRELNAEAEMVIASRRHSYFPVEYIEPVTRDEETLGFDLASNEKYLAPLLEAKEGGKKTAVTRFSQPQQVSSDVSVLIFNPIYERMIEKSHHESDNLLGFVLLVLQVDEMMGDVLAKQAEALPTSIQDVSIGGSNEVLYGQEKIALGAIDHSETIAFAGSQWKIRVSKTPDNSLVSWVSWLVLGIGLIFSAIVTLGLSQLIHRREILERVVEQRTQELAQLVENLTDSNEELTRFAFVCSHDLQEPLRMIRSFSEKLQTHMGDDLDNDERGKKYFRFITEGATRAQDLISDILMYSSIGGDTEGLEQIQMGELIRAVKENMLVSIEECGGRVTYGKLPTLRGNKTQLFQLIHNLTINGLKYRDSNRTPNVHVSAEDSGEYWKFSVSDNGIGMEERHLEKIFEVFQRLHGKSKYTGTGVGLSICRKVVERHYGTIWATSEKGVGSTFYFTLLKLPNEEPNDGGND